MIHVHQRLPDTAPRSIENSIQVHAMSESKLQLLVQHELAARQLAALVIPHVEHHARDEGRRKAA